MRNDIIVQKLIAYSRKVVQYCDGVTYSEFIADSKLLEACVFNLSQMGELVKKLEDTFITQHSDIPWRAIYGLRNRIVHDYDGVNLTLIWDIISEDLPSLLKQLEKIA